MNIAVPRLCFFCGGVCDEQCVFMDILQSIVLGLIQGLTEFLPVSSSGHLELFKRLFHIPDGGLFYDVILHVGTLIPVFIIFRQQLWELIKNPFQRLTFLLIVSTLPTVVIALIFKQWIPDVLEGSWFIGISFIITGLMLLFADTKKSGRKKVKNIRYVDAVMIGVAQGVGVLPGISRSGATITGALVAGLEKETAANYAFLLSIPAIAGALVLTGKDIMTGEAPMGDVTFLPGAIGFIVAALTGYAAISFMLDIIKRKSLSVFSYYLFSVGALVLIDHFFLKMFF